MLLVLLSVNNCSYTNVNASISLTPHQNVVCMSVCACPCVHVRVCMSVCACPCVHVRVCMSVCACPCVHACMHVCVWYYGICYIKLQNYIHYVFVNVYYFKFIMFSLMYIILGIYCGKNSSCKIGICKHGGECIEGVGTYTCKCLSK